jgi:hypothetical protein
MMHIAGPRTEDVQFLVTAGCGRTVARFVFVVSVHHAYRETCRTYHDLAEGCLIYIKSFVAGAGGQRNGARRFGE